MLRDWGVCWLLAVFSVCDLSRQSMILVGPIEDAGRQLISLAARCIALGRSTFVSASLLHDPIHLAHRSQCILGDRFLVYMSSTAPLLLHPPIRSEICTLPSFSGIAQTHMPDVLTLCRAALGTNVVVCGAANFGTDRAVGIDYWSRHVAAWR